MTSRYPKKKFDAAFRDRSVTSLSWIRQAAAWSRARRVRVVDIGPFDVLVTEGAGRIPFSIARRDPRPFAWHLITEVKTQNRGAVAGSRAVERVETSVEPTQIERLALIVKLGERRGGWPQPPASVG